MEKRPTYLIMVTESNNNKYYNAFPDNNGDTFTVKYGRINSTETTVQYNMDMWDKKLNEKLKKGYKDVTELKLDLVEQITADNKDNNIVEYKEIEIESVRRLINYLQSIARDTIKKNYTVSSAQITEDMIEEAQSIINNLTNILDREPSEFNKELIKLYTILPRNMNNVSDFLSTDKGSYNSIINREQSLLDVLRGQVYKPEKRNTVNTSNKQDGKEITILDELGLEITEATEEDIKKIKKIMGESADKFKKAWRVTNHNTQDRYDKYIRENNINNTKLIFHGSRSENWFSILKMGLKIRPSNAVYTGSMFGDGIYGATKCQKSIGYTSLHGSYWAGGKSNTGYLALMEVAYGTPYNVYSFSSKYYNMTYNKLPVGTNCLHAHAGNGMLRNDEIVLYREDQVTIKYLIEIG